MPRIQKKAGKKYLADVPAEYVFRCCDTCVFKNMQELGDGLANMAEETYAYHANTEKNDFSRWVRDIIKDEKLATGLWNAKSKSEAASVVASRITSLMRPVRTSTK